MTYSLDKSQKAIQKAAFEFAKGEFDGDAARESDQKGIFPEVTWSKAAELGFIGIHHPEKYSGGGLGHLEHVLIAEVFTTSDSTLGAAIMLAGLASEWIVQFGTDIQKKMLLPEIYEGRKKTGIALDGIPLGNNDDGVSFKNENSSDHSLITGELKHVINGKDAEIVPVLCYHFEGGRLTDKCSMLLLDGKSPGITMGKEYSLLGLRATGMTSYFLKNVESYHISIFTPKDNQLLKIQSAFYLLMAALALGTAQGAFDRAMAHVKDREQFGKKLAGFQVIQHKLARMALQIEQSRCLTYIAANHADSKKVDTKMPVMANLAATKTAVEVSYESIQLLGGYGYTTEYDVERCYRDAKALQILSGYEHELLDQVSAGLIGRLHK